jgi:putative ubiquitin-RnfH superfamily antitoxin RatB of RatAB toxin-antitoxin module
MSGAVLWGRISDVSLDDVSTWAARTFLTVDMDWAHDDVMRDTHSILTAANVTSTWFVTHDSPFITELRDDPNVELGIHPNFNQLLAGSQSHGHSALDVVERLLDFVPEAKSVRSHSLVQGSRILDAYRQSGLTHDATHFVEPSAAESPRPWRHWNGLVRVPLTWEDDVACIQTPGKPRTDTSPARGAAGIRQLNFHPVHVFLNTEELGRYERTRPLHCDPKRLEKERHSGVGVRTLLNQIIAGNQH